MKILVVEDDRAIAEVVERLLANYNYAADIAVDGLAGLAMAEAFEYDLVIADIGLPQLDGVELCKRLRDRHFGNPILLLSGNEGSGIKAIALNAGADDYVVKPFDSMELIARVQALLRRPATGSQPILTWGNLAFDPNRRRVTYKDRLLKLTPKEYAILELLLRSPQMALSARSILDRAWTADEAPADESVRAHIKELRRKLTAVSAPKDFIKTVHGVGYQLNLLYAAELGKRLTTPQVVELAAVNEDLRGVLAQLRSTQDTLRASEERYRLLSEISPVGIFRNDPSGVCTYVNNRTARLVGVPPADCVGRNWVETLHPDDRQWVCATYAAFVTRSMSDPTATVSFECRHLHSDGKIVWVLVNIVPERHLRSAIRGYMGTLTDITDRKQAEARLQRAAELDAFRVKLSDTLRSLVDPVEIQVIASRLLGEYLGANRVAYFEVRGTDYVVDRDYVNGVTALMGRYPIDTYSPKLLAEYRAGRIVSSSEVAADPNLSPAERSAYSALQIAAHIGIPLIKGGEFVAGLAVHMAAPRDWTPDEVSLVAEVADRTWAKTERARAEAALRESEQRLQVTISNLPGGATFVVDRDLRYLLAEGEALSAAGFQPADLVGKTIFEAFAPELAADHEQLYRQALGGESFVREHNAHGSWYVTRGTPLRSSSGETYAVLAVSYDISDRKQAEAHLQRAAELDAFRVTLADLLRSIADPIPQRGRYANEIQATACRLLGERLGVDRAYYVEVNEAEGYARVNRNYLRGDSPSIVGTFRLVDYGWTLPLLRRGETIVVMDVESSDIIPAADLAAMVAVRMAAHISLPIIKQGVLMGALCVTEPIPRQWSEIEVKLVSETAARIWEAIERARAEAALRKSEAKYRSLFESIDEGFCLLEILFDATETAYDYRFLEVNAAFAAQSGLTAAVGKTILELVPNVEPQWAEHYGRVAKSGNAVRFEANVPSMNRIFDIYAYPGGGAGENVVAVLFTDITDRKRTEANLALLAEVSDALVGLEQIEQTIERLGETIGRYFGVKYCMFAEHADELETAIAYGWNAADVPAIGGTYRMRDFLTDAELAAILTGKPLIISDTQTDARVSAESYGALNIHSFILVPLLRDRQWQFQISIIDNTPRQWRDDEVELLRELTTRIWTRLERARAEQAAAADLRDTQLLQELGARLVTEADFQTLYQEIISAAIAIVHAEAGTVQILDETSQELLLLATQGFDRPMTDRFYRVDGGSNTPCGIAMRHGNRTFVDFDVPESEDPDGSMRMHVAAGYLSAQSTPLIARSGRSIGMMSTHWRECYRPSERELRFLDLLARQAADSIEQRQTAIALRDREQQLRLASAAAQVGMWFWNLETDSLIWTDQCKALFGLPAETEMSYAVFLNAIHPDDRERTDTAVSRSIAERTEYEIEYRCCWTDGSTHWIAAKGSCTYDSTDKPVRMMGVAIDISERKQAEIDLAERNQELDSFVYVVSHDLKAPLRAISNLSVWIEEDFGTELPPVTQEQMAQLRERVHRMEAIIDGLLQYARIGRTDDQIQLVSVAELVAQTIDSIAPPATFEIVIAPDLPTFHTKQLLLSQVFANLISNAFKHHNRADGCVRISCRERDEFYEFAIADDGPGIAPHQHERVFVIFQSTKVQTNPDSTGIGLSIVKKIVETAGGRIWLESELGRGTTFYFTWPQH